MSQHALVLMHVPFEGPAAIKHWLTQHNIDCKEKHAPHIEAWQTLELPDWLVVMGGPMSVNDTAQHPWISQEIAFIRRAIDAGTRVVGVCLGAQLIAKSLGASVVRNAHAEIGWFEIRATDTGRQYPLGALFTDNPCVLHWHGDTFELPYGAQLLASSDACRNQIFTYGTNVLGLQCHLEMGRPQVERLARECADELAAGGHYVQPATTILAATQPFDTAQRLLDQLLSGFESQASNLRAQPQ